jgi:phosphatidylethanolamine-binding protein (PEBP) family uncharacterized protein
MRCPPELVFLGSLLVAISWGLTSLAHPGGHGSQRRGTAAHTFRLTTGERVARGELLFVRDGLVRIRAEAGDLVDVPLAGLSNIDQVWVRQVVSAVRERNAPGEWAVALRGPDNLVAGQRAEKEAPEIARDFQPFEKTVGIRWDRDFLFVESNGMPEHPMMVGIRSWQQQVPLPQDYRGDNAWRIPRNPVPARNPQSTRNDFLRGAIALAVNGIPIFNPLNNRGDDAFLAGELDEFGGHCGRADDYHYHLAPVHLEKVVGHGKPIAYALDGYPVYGYQQPGDPDFAPLDKLNGHRGKDGNYHYHATKTYPYLIGGFFGEVTKREGQVDPQPRAEPVREALPPLKGAKITRFESLDANAFRLTYEIGGRSGTVEYRIAEGGKVAFTYRDPRGKVTTEVAEPRRPQRGDGRGRRGDGPRGGDDRPPRDNRRPAPRNDSSPRPLGLSSQSIDAEGLLNVDCTCDGKSLSPAIAWKQLPEGTRSWAVSLWHTAPDQEKSYWLVYDLPVDVKELKQGMKPAGKTGQNDRRRPSYEPLCSKGPGRKTYHLTVYALSEQPTFRSGDPSRADFLKAIEGLILAQETLDFDYERRPGR